MTTVWFVIGYYENGKSHIMGLYPTEKLAYRRVIDLETGLDFDFDNIIVTCRETTTNGVDTYI